MRKRFGFINTLVIGVLSLGFISTASAAYVTESVGKATGTLTVDTSTRAVCYVVQGSTTTYYSNLDTALSSAYGNSATDTIYVLPSLGYGDLNLPNTTQLHITKNATIESTDTLILPYGEDSSGNLVWDTRDGSNNVFGDESQAKVIQNMAVEVVVDEGVSLNIYGQVDVGGVVGNNGPGNGLSGQTGGAYAQISLSAGTSIYVNSGATLDVRGYIKEYDETAGEESAGIQVMQGGAFITPIVFYDYKGGTYSVYIYTAGAGELEFGRYAAFGGTVPDGVFPISIFDFPNSQVYTQINYGATYQALGDVYLNDAHKTFSFNLVSTGIGSAFQTTGGGSDYISFDYNPAFTFELSGRTMACTVNDRKSYSTYGGAVTDIDVSGSLTMNDMVIEDFVEVLSVTVDATTENKFYPISYKMNINVSSGTMTLPIQAKFMPGSQVSVQEGATIVMNSNVAFYPSTWTDQTGIAAYAYPSGLSSARLINNGTLDINSGFGAYIETENIEGTGSMNFASSSCYSVSSPEYNGSGAFSDPYYVSVSATGDMYYENSLIQNAALSTYHDAGLGSFYSREGYTQWCLDSSIVSLTISYAPATSVRYNPEFSFTVSETEYNQDNFSGSVLVRGREGDSITIKHKNLAYLSLGSGSIIESSNTKTQEYSYTFGTSNGTLSLVPTSLIDSLKVSFNYSGSSEAYISYKKYQVTATFYKLENNSYSSLTSANSEAFYDYYRAWGTTKSYTYSEVYISNTVYVGDYITVTKHSSSEGTPSLNTVSGITSTSASLGTRYLISASASAGIAIDFRN